MQKPIEVEEALKAILERIAPRGEEQVNLWTARGRVLSREVRARVDLPPFTSALRDGYALRASSVTSARPEYPVSLRIVEEVPAGHWPTRGVGPQETARIMTGAPLPVGADAVLPFEYAREGAGQVEVLGAVAPGEYLLRQGEILRCGQVVARRGEVITPGLMGLLASSGAGEVWVYTRPRVGVLATGTELARPGQPLRPGQIWASNLPTLCALVEEYGCEPVPLGVVPDEVAALREAIQQAAGLDGLITTGGVSGGRYDLMEKAVRGLGLEILFHRVAMKPGAPTLVAARGRWLLFALSGSPGAAYVSALVLVVPALRKLKGEAEWRPVRLRAVLTEGLERPVDAVSYLQVRVAADGGLLKAQPVKGIPRRRDLGPAKASGLVRLEPGRNPKTGEEVEVFLYALPFPDLAEGGEGGK